MISSHSMHDLNKLSDATLARMIVACRELTRQTVSRETYHGMAPYNLWVKLILEQGRREKLVNKKYCKECGQPLE